ncbi:elongation factor Ts [Calothrix sp. NIES-4071]|nr:elongation factor Ts [Calothrix sp. NIES-4071]BAZ61166.1 elongation factor Ts [Calothrix sp. NIES-4105]
MTNIPAKLIQALRDKTGAGWMDCKQALIATNGDIVKAEDWLRTKGITSAGNKGERTTAEGVIGSYIHTGGKVGVLVEVNCETDFVARTEEFQNLVRNIAMQIAASGDVKYVKVEDIPTNVIDKEKSIAMGRDDLANKPENIRTKIVQGRVEKVLKEMCLLNQPYARDPNITIEELICAHIAKLGENIQVKRFVRFILGENAIL